MATSAEHSLDDSLGFNLNRVAQLYRRELTRALVEYELTPEQWQILAALAESGNPLSQAEIAALTFKDKHSTSRMLDRMEQARWIVRAPHPEDARAAAVTLGPRGDEVPKIRRLLRSHFMRINAALGEAQQKQLLALLRVLRTSLGD
jgi:DNA-binding MarR family transcriptional regulator